MPWGRCGFATCRGVDVVLQRAVGLMCTVPWGRSGFAMCRGVEVLRVVKTKWIPYILLFFEKGRVFGGAGCDFGCLRWKVAMASGWLISLRATHWSSWSG